MTRSSDPSPTARSTATDDLGNDLLRGTLELLILRVLALGPLHGWAIAQRIELESRNALRVNQGSLYPALHRLEGKELLDTSWSLSENGRRVKTYQLSVVGRRQLTRETRRWLEYSDAVHLVLEAK